MSAANTAQAPKTSQPAGSASSRIRNLVQTRSAKVPRLSLVPAPQHRIPFMAVLVSFLAAGLIGLLVVTINLQNQAFQLSELETQTARLSYREAELQSELTKAESAVNLNQSAGEQGMRPNDQITMITLPDGRIIGKAAPAGDKYPRSSVQKSPEQLAREAQEARRRAASDRIKAAEQERQLRRQQLEQPVTASAEPATPAGSAQGAATTDNQVPPAAQPESQPAGGNDGG